MGQADGGGRGGRRGGIGKDGQRESRRRRRAILFMTEFHAALYSHFTLPYSAGGVPPAPRSGRRAADAGESAARPRFPSAGRPRRSSACRRFVCWLAGIASVGSLLLLAHICTGLLVSRPLADSCYDYQLTTVFFRPGAERKQARRRMYGH